MATENTALIQRAESVPTESAFGSNEGFDTAQRVARALAASTIVPANYRNNLPNVLVAMEYAHRIGASVLAVMQNLAVIEGKPSLAASFLIGTVNACGRFTPIRFRWQGVQGEDTWGCSAVATDRESGEECPGSLITIALAKAEGWFGRNGSKWRSMPQQMLMYRAAAWWARVYAPELSMGMHTEDEVQDIGPLPEQRARTLAVALDADDPPAADAQPVDDPAQLALGGA